MIPSAEQSRQRENVEMKKIVELSVEEANSVAGGVFSYTRVDPKTGETVVYDCTGREIARYQSAV
jgi:hypothetical protein